MPGLTGRVDGADAGVVQRTVRGRGIHGALLCLVAVAVGVAGCREPGAGPVRGLTGLHIAAGAGLYPDFDPAVLHYAVRCADGSVLQVAVQAPRDDATVRMLHDGSTASGSMRAAIAVDSDHDIAVEVGGAHGPATYVLHCIPPDFPDITLEARTAAVSDGLLLMTPGAPAAVRRSWPSWTTTGCRAR